MKKNLLAEMTEVEIVEEFMGTAIKQKEASEKDNFSLYNKLFARIVDLAAELKTRPGDRRRALLVFLDHENIQVRLMAANETLAVAPTAARRVLEDIADSNWYPFAMDARSTLSGLDSGTFHPE